jgi:hypothetical protein
MASLEPLRSLRQPLAGALLRGAARLAAAERHPLAPAALRVERTRARRGAEVAEQTAVTLWFGEGPELPAPGLSRSAWRAAAGVGATLAGAAALAVASTVAAQREGQRRLAAARPVPALPSADRDDRHVTSSAG